MAITRETLRLSRDLRIVLRDVTDASTRRLVEAWARAWTQIEAEWTSAVDDLVAAGDGQWPSKMQIVRATRAQRALSLATDELFALSEFAGVTVIGAVPDVVGPAAEWQARLIASQMPRSAGTTAELAAVFDRVDPDALGAIVERTTERVTSLTRPLAANAAEAMAQALVRGVAVGDNPRTAARAMVRKVEGAFNGGLTRALTIARTELLDAHRSGAAAAQFANADVLAGWVWTAQLDRRTCPACFSMHGSLHDLSEVGPMGHQQCRCARTPRAKSWRQLGFNIDEPSSVLPDAQAAFRSLSKADQLAVMGPLRLGLLNDGRIGWGQLAQRRSTKGWRDSYNVRPVRDLLHPRLR